MMSGEKDFTSNNPPTKNYSSTYVNEENPKSADQKVEKFQAKREENKEIIKINDSERQKNDFMQNPNDTPKILEPNNIIKEYSPHLHDIDYYSLWKDHIKIKYQKKEKESQSFLSPVSRKSRLRLDNYTISILRHGDMSKKTAWIFKYTKGDLSYVIKRSQLKLNREIEKKSDLLLLGKDEENFIRKMQLEYMENFIFGSSPFGVEVLGINFTYVPSTKILNSEFLMEYAGLSILDEKIATEINWEEEKNIINLIKNLIGIAHVLECKKLLHNDIKNENIALSFNKEKKMYYVKLFDFDVGEIQSITEKDSQKKAKLSYTSFYVAPEVLKHNELLQTLEDNKKKNLNSQEIKEADLEINLWSSQIYSLGMTSLEILIHYDKTVNYELQNIVYQKGDFDKAYKIGLNSYQAFINLLKKEKNDPKRSKPLQNIYQLIYFCLDWKPECRPNSVILSLLANDIESLDPTKFESKFHELMQKKKPLAVNSKIIEHLQDVNILDMKNYILNFNVRKDQKLLSANDLPGKNRNAEKQMILQNSLIDSLVKERENYMKSCDILMKERDNLIKTCNDLEKERDNLQVQTNNLVRENSHLKDKLDIIMDENKKQKEETKANYNQVMDRSNTSNALLIQVQAINSELIKQINSLQGGIELAKEGKKNNETQQVIENPIQGINTGSGDPKEMRNEQIHNPQEAQQEMLKSGAIKLGREELNSRNNNQNYEEQRFQNSQEPISLKIDMENNVQTKEFKDNGKAISKIQGVLNEDNQNIIEEKADPKCASTPKNGASNLKEEKS